MSYVIETNYEDYILVLEYDKINPMIDICDVTVKTKHGNIYHGTYEFFDNNLLNFISSDGKSFSGLTKIGLVVPVIDNYNIEKLRENNVTCIIWRR